MIIHMTRFLALFFIFGFSTDVFANDSKDKSLYDHFKGLILDTPPPRPTLSKKYPTDNNIDAIIKHTRVNHMKVDDSVATACITSSPHHNYSIMENIGQSARVIANNLNKDIKSFTFQPRFGGLKGPKITIMRKDLEHALIHKQGSAQEIFHNTHITTKSQINCNTGITYNNHYIIHNHVDTYESDVTPLIRSSLKWRNELNLGQYLMGTMSTRYALGDNLDKDRNLNILDRPDPIRQDVIAFQYQNVNLERLMLSGLATPRDNLYIAGHIGYLEEMFAGAGAEILYRPFDEQFAIGAEAWNTIKRAPYNGSIWATDNHNRQQSYLLNAWYDLSETPLSFGTSVGRFLDGDIGIELKSRWTPKPGWRVEGVTTFTNENDTTLGNDKNECVYRIARNHTIRAI